MTHQTIPQMLDRRARELRQRRRMALLHDILSTAFFLACAGFVVLMWVRVATAGAP